MASWLSFKPLFVDVFVVSTMLKDVGMYKPQLFPRGSRGNGWGLVASQDLLVSLSFQNQRQAVHVLVWESLKNQQKYTVIVEIGGI